MSLNCVHDNIFIFIRWSGILRSTIFNTPHTFQYFPKNRLTLSNLCFPSITPYMSPFFSQKMLYMLCVIWDIWCQTILFLKLIFVTNSSLRDNRWIIIIIIFLNIFPKILNTVFVTQFKASASGYRCLFCLCSFPSPCTTSHLRCGGFSFFSVAANKC